MKLTLVNFKCHTFKVVNIPENNLVLLQGNNGTGKTTIFKAVIYVLYGTIKNPCTWESKENTSVELETEDILIKRTHKPSTLRVQIKDNTYQEEIAQGIINEMFMNKWEFLASSLFSHITQNIVDLPSQARIDFLWKLENADTMAKEYSTKLKTVKKELLSKIPITRDRLTRNEEELKIIYDRLPEDIDDIFSSFEDDIDIIKQELDKKFSTADDLNKSLVQNKDLLKKHKKQVETIQEVNDKITKLTTEFTELQSKKKTPKDDEINNQISMTQKAIEKTKICIEKVLLLAKKKQCEKNIIRSKNEYQKNIEDELQKLYNTRGGKDDLNKLLEEKQKLKEEYELQQQNIGQYEKNKANKDESLLKIKDITLKSKKQFGFQLDKVVTTQKLRNFLLEKREAMMKEMSLSSLIYTTHNQPMICPECENELSVTKDQKLVCYKKPTKKISSVVKKEMDLLQNNFELINTYIAEIDLHEKNIDMKLTDVKRISYDDIKNMETAISTNKKIEELKQKKNADGAYTEQLQKELNDLDNKLEDKKFSHIKIDETKNYEKELTSLEQELEKLIKKKNISEQNDLRITELTIELTKLRKEKKTMNLSEDYDKLRIEIENSEIMCNKLYAEIKSDTAHLNKKLETQKLCKKYMKRIVLEEENTTLVCTLKKMEKDLLNIGRLLSEIKESKVEYIDQFIGVLNECCSKFFEPIFGGETSFYMQIDNLKLKLCVTHKGVDNVNIKDLSAGEVQKCKLIFLFAFNMMYDSSYLFMDEFLHSTDEIKSTEILRYIKTNFPKKTVVCALHKCTNGVFNHVINI